MNMLDYIVWRGDLTLKQNPFNEVDGAILARLSYVPFEVFLPNSHKSFTIAAAAKSLPAGSAAPLKDADIAFLKALGQSKRFCNMRISSYVSQSDEQAQMQFSAITVRLSLGVHYIAYRGTDDTLVGWKEDFNMAFVTPVPAQEMAVAYLNRIALRKYGKLLVGGHSKGGNLAVYACAFCKDPIKPRISLIYNYDGPGFTEQVVQERRYKEICRKVQTFVPQDSIVGILLGHEEAYTTVYSTGKNRMWQHEMLTWEVQQNSFVHLEKVNDSTRFLDRTLKAWISDMDYAQREQFVDAIYAVMVEAKADTVMDLMENRFVSAKAALYSFRNFDESMRKGILQSLSLLARRARESLSQLRQ